MKVNMLKVAGGNLMPLDDLDTEKMTRFKTGETYEIEIKLSRNPRFHGKVFAFFNFCYDHWDEQACFEYMDNEAQFEEFRNSMTIQAGYYTETWDPFTGELKLKAKSLSYASMEQDAFELLYNALIRVALRMIFQGCDKSVENKLTSFF